MRISKAALAATLLAGGATLAFDAAPASAQALDSLRNRQRSGHQQQQREQQRQQTRIGTLSGEESAVLLPLYQAAQAHDWTAARAALPAARSGASSPAGKFLVGQIMYQIARATQDQALEGEAVTQMIQSGGATQEQLAELQSVQSAQAFNSAIASGNSAAIEAQLEQRLAASPNDLNLVTQLAEVKIQLNKRDQALELLRRAIQMTQASGQPVSENLYRRATGLAYDSHNGPVALELARTLLQAYPNPANWRSALGIYRQLGNVDSSAQLDVFRLMRAAGALTSEREYVEYSEAANSAAAFGEVKAVLDEAVGRNVITAANSGFAREMLAATNRRIAEDQSSLTAQRSRVLAGSDARAVLRLADAYYGYGQYAEAAALYRAALQKGADSNLANLRMGAALAMAGQRAEAEAALRAVTGTRADLANYWLLWLAGRS
jgi:thioredoxin-like negative regulator of GroEL